MSSIYIGSYVGLLTVTSSLFRRHAAGGEVGVAVEAQHACGVCGRVIMATSFFRAHYMDRGDYGRQLWHPAWSQLYTTQTHHQPVPHCRHPPLLEHAAWVMHIPAKTHSANVHPEMLPGWFLLLCVFIFIFLNIYFWMQLNLRFILL